MKGYLYSWCITAACLLVITVSPGEAWTRKNAMSVANWSTPLVGGHTEGNSVTSSSSKFDRIKKTLKQVLFVSYEPHSEDQSFMDRAQVQTKNDVSVKVAVMSGEESKRYFGRALSRKGIQPVYIEVTNNGKGPLFFDCAHLDPNYYPPLEAAMLSHFLNLKRLVISFGILAIFFLPLLLILPSKKLSSLKANRRMDEFFCSQTFQRGFINESQAVKGFVFCSLDDGTKICNIKLLAPDKTHDFTFSVPVPGIAVDYEGKSDFLTLFPPSSLVPCDLPTLRKKLENEPRATTNAKGTREGDPANLVVIGDFKTLLTAFGSQWDETEVISLDTCIKTAKSFVFGSAYRSSPVSALYMFGRAQDFALQRARGTISERLHLRLWMTPLRFEDKPVWLGQISRDIGVKFAKTWNLTTHKVDPNVDEARDYLISNLLESGYLDRAGLVGGVGISTEEDPRKNLGNDPYVTDGKRAVVILSPTKTKAKLLG